VVPPPQPQGRAAETGIPVQALAAAARNNRHPRPPREVPPGQPSLRHAARQLGIRYAILADRVRQLEDVTGITLLTTRPDGTVTLTPDGEQFALTVRPVLESLAQSRSQDASYAP